MINTCKILRVIAIRTYCAEQLIFWSKMRISAQYVRVVRIGHSYVRVVRIGHSYILGSLTYEQYLMKEDTFNKFEKKKKKTSPCLQLRRRGYFKDHHSYSNAHTYVKDFNMDFRATLFSITSL